MSPWIARAAILAASVAMIVIRAPHGQRSRVVKVRDDRKGLLETVLLGFAVLGFVAPLIWIFSPVLSFADYALHPVPFVAGTALLVLGLWLFHRSHADLGTNWSITLQLRDTHQLVSRGVYRRIRHPMYSALFLYSVGQLLALPNWVAGPSYLVPFGILFALRVGVEERMMLDAFGDEYRTYMARTKRLVPGVW